MGGSVWEVVGGKDSGGITVRTGKELKSPESPDGRLSHGALVAELQLEGERLRFTRLTGTGPNDGWISLSFKNRPLVVRSGEIGSKVAEDAAELERAKANKGIMQPKPGAYRLWLLPQGSRGDVTPMLALGIAARKEGWAVHLMASMENKDFVESYGIQFTPCGPVLGEVITEKTANDTNGEKMEEYTNDPSAFGGDAINDIYNKETQREMGNILLAELEKAKQEDCLPDMIFFHCLHGLSSYLAWHRYGVPICRVDYTNTAVVPDEQWEEEASKLKEENGKELEEQHGENVFANWDTKALAIWLRDNTLCCTSKLLLCECMDISGFPQEAVDLLSRKFLGPMIIDPASQMVDLSYFGGQETLRGLQEFLDAGPKPAYVGWGSMPMNSAFLSKVILNLKLNKIRAIVLGGWAALSREAFHEFLDANMADDPFGLRAYAETNIYFTKVAPHEWILQRCLFTVHHGGAGTTQAALRAGVPTIITPFSFDQFMYAEWVTKLGCGQQLSLTDNKDKLMDPAYSKAFRKAGTDKDMAENARWVAEEIRKECGTARVLQVIQDAIEKHARGETKGLFGA